MDIYQEKESFTPVVIKLESVQEVNVLAGLLNNTDITETFTPEENDIINELCDELGDYGDHFEIGEITHKVEEAIDQLVEDRKEVR